MGDGDVYGKSGEETGKLFTIAERQKGMPDCIGECLHWAVVYWKSLAVILIKSGLISRSIEGINNKAIPESALRVQCPSLMRRP